MGHQHVLVTPERRQRSAAVDEKLQAASNS
jgi:hypothetical protein